MKKYVVCGLSKRALSLFIGPMLDTFSSKATIVGLLDSDPKRFDVCKSTFPLLSKVPYYSQDDFDEMIMDTEPDVVLVTSRDDTHVTYILSALEKDLDVVVEKPMATTGEDSRKIIEAEAKSKGTVTVTFNYRYTPIHTKIKEMILDGKVGRITSVDLNWYIDTYHGSSYFQRWNRSRNHSGGLSIHKSSHHFDLVSWWTDQKPVEAFAYGALNYYGDEGSKNPEKQDGRFCRTCDVKFDCDYYRRWNSRSQHTHIADDHIGGAESDPNAYTGYRSDQCIYDSEIDIEDTYTATVKYEKGALLSYSVNFSLPYEGYRLAINGTEGRIETLEYHMPARTPFPTEVQTIDYFPLFGSKETIHVVHKEGGHGGADPIMLEDIFLGADPSRSYKIKSGSEDGAYAVATGEAVWRSVKENQPVSIKELLSKTSQNV